MKQEKMIQAVTVSEKAVQEFSVDNLLENMTNWLFYCFLITGIPLIFMMIFVQ